ncbi:uncharacterized protein BO88DRAFT_454887 [Aspergillus vadensis CBS 113365]|uniref:Uncharacterized protein n=1 Tax=Aspergillus vadensis (strain CBS 113365 / IMI 142717 / IBT 24658) TaxID=1448311 RepID=A0A319B846_ASPVC|nr:hypothetical protein BO88DRAFT_454887 [Aspergillus vadensis CBS 113365]PYH67994.1 hypothetical protein BO88DRAFT_454887 [Aspergillus vadensis CBS 113365]
MSGGDEKEVHWFRVINNSGAAQKYIFFAPPPSPDFDTPVCFASGNHINNETVWNVHTTAPIFAGVGTLEGDHVNIDQDHWWDSGIEDGGPEKFDLVFKDGDVGLHDSGENVQTPNTFKVASQDIPNDDKTYVIGFGKRNPNETSQEPGPILPCATIGVKPNNSQEVAPIIQLYVSNTPKAPGDLINFNDLSEKSAHINFTGHTKDAALCTILHKAEGGTAVWDTAYDNTLP